MIHMIRQQYVHVELNGTESDGMALQRRLPDLCDGWLTPAIEQALARCTPPDGHLTIERLDIDVGMVTLENLEQALPELVALALENAIRERMLAEAAPVATLADELVQHKTAQQAMHEAFIHFLETGNLPWSFRLPKDTHLEQALLKSWREAATLGEPLRAVRDAILQALASATVRQRLIRQFSPGFLEALLSLLSPDAKSMVEGVMPVLRSAAVSSAEITPFEQKFWQNVFADVAADHVLSARCLVSESWRTLSTTATESGALASVLERHWPGITRMALSETNQIEHTESILPTPSGLSPPPSPDSEATQSTTSDTPEVKEPRGGNAIREHPEAQEGIYVENAGLVLLHPFLPRFFAALDIADENTLLQPERALCLLHFLATGQSTAPEYKLALPKILCNIPLLAPVETNQGLTNAEAEEAVVLLEAVIRHWSVLRNTSPDGLRGTFLLRPGKVSLRDDGDWLLQVESNSVDILLDQLPWGIAMIKLPWMDTMLWVAWR